MVHSSDFQRLKRRKGVAAQTPHDFMIQRVRMHAFQDDPEFHRFFHGSSEISEARTLDYLFATETDEHEPNVIFEKMRWGGQFVFASRFPRQVRAVAEEFAEYGFVVERGPERVCRRWMGIPISNVRPALYFFVARKVLLIAPGEHSQRFTFDVHLEQDQGEWIVAKQVPTVEDLHQRLVEKCGPESGDVEQHAHQLAEGVLPIFLTREAAFLQILQRDMPDADRCRVPTALEVEKNDRGLVTKLKLNWLRKTDRLMSQLDFAIQAADLLHKLHHHAKIIHLDLRLDNFVITDDGVGFVDFGSAARMDEDVSASPMLQKLFGQLMRTSQVQRLLNRMASTGHITNDCIRKAYGRVDRAADIFSLALQMDKPGSNPYTREIVCCHPESREARKVHELAKAILQPENPQVPRYATARDILHGLRDIKDQLTMAA